MVMLKQSQPSCGIKRKPSTTNKHLFYGPLSGTTQVSPYQKGKTNLNFTEARDSEWQWRQLGHMHLAPDT